MADNTEMQVEYRLFADVWSFFKKNYNPTSDEDYWNKLIEASHEIESRYKSVLCRDLLVLIIAELERKYNYQNPIKGGDLYIENK